MPHQHHFLSRLDRVSTPHVDFALSLYRDHELIEYLLQHVTLPEGAERVAISLQDPALGPFVIVTRAGRFVTCLGAGMKPGKLPIVTRERLDGLAVKLGDLRARLAAGRAHGTERLLSRLYSAGDALSREEMIAATGVAPLMRRELLELVAEAELHVHEVRRATYALLRRTPKPRPTYRPGLAAYYRLVWFTIHASVLIAADGRELFEKVAEDRAVVNQIGRAFTRSFFEHGQASHASRALWCTGKLGKIFLPSYKEAWNQVSSAYEVIETALAMAAIGVRHAHTRAEVRKVIASLPKCFGRDPADKLHGFASSFAKVMEHAFDDAELNIAAVRKTGARYAVQLGEDVPAESPYRYARPEDVPDAIALPLAANLHVSIWEETSWMMTLLHALPWLARAKPEDLYLPRAYLAEAYRWPWDPDSTLSWFRKVAEVRKAAMRTPRPEGPTRSGPCPCGSGKKYKRCCADREQV